MSFGVKCITIPSVKMISGDYSRSRVYYPNEEALIEKYKGRDREVSWINVYTEDFGSDSFFVEGWYEVYKGEIPERLRIKLLEQNLIVILDRDWYVELNQQSLDIIRKHSQKLVI